MQAQLREVGISLRIKYVDSTEYRELIFQKRKFDLTMNIWSFNELEDIFLLFRSGQLLNFINYSNPTVDAKLDASEQEEDYKVYKEQMQELHTILNKDLPYVFLWSLDVYSGLSRQLQNVFIQPYYYFTFFRDWSFR